MKHGVFSLPSGTWGGNFAGIAVLEEKTQTPALTCQTTASSLENTWPHFCLSGSKNVCMCRVRSQHEKLTTLLQTFPFSCPKTRKTKFSPSLARDIQGLRSNRDFYIPQSLGRKAGAGTSSLSLGCFLSK